MAGKRTKDRGLTDSRIYKRHKKYYYLSPTPYVNPRTNKKARWHSLCNILDGEIQARKLAQEIISFNTVEPDQGDMSTHLTHFLVEVLSEREEKRPTDVEKLKMFIARNKTIETIINVLKRSFFEFDVAIVEPVDVANFLDAHKDKRRMAQVYRSTLLDFFKYATRKGLVSNNPVRDVSVKPPKKRHVYVTDEQFNKIYSGLNAITRCYINLCYLTYQRSTEIRLLKWTQIKPDGIYFKPTKTEHSSSADVIVPITPEIQAELDIARSLCPADSEYVICSKNGKPFTASGVRSNWDRACKKAGVSGVTIKDLRPKSLTDASKAGFKIEQISIGAAHTDKETTEGYIKIKPIPRSEVNLKLPKENK